MEQTLRTTSARLSRTLFAAFIVTSIGDVAFAESSGRKIEEVIVTAERQEASIQDTSISITAFTAEFIDDYGIRNQEDLQNFIPATTIQPYDATIRGVGRNFRSLGGDPGVAVYTNGVYSEDLITATAATFWDVERIEVLRGPQGTLYGRNAVGGAINILYKKPTQEFEGAVKAIIGDYGTQEYYGAISGGLIEDQLSARLNFSYRDRDGVVDEIGPGEDLNSLGTENVAVQFKWTPTENIEVNLRQNWMEIDRSIAGTSTGAAIVLNQEDSKSRVSGWLTPGYRFIDTNNTDPANSDQRNFYDASQPILEFTNPNSGVIDLAQRVRPGLDYGDFDGYQSAAASMDGFNNTSPESAARLDACVLPKDPDGDDVCASTNGLNNEFIEQQGTQFDVTWDVNDALSIKYIYGYSKFDYQRYSDDDQTASLFHDKTFYVNHEPRYTSHELQFFYDIGENVSVTSGIFFYDASINQRGDIYTAVGERRMVDEYEDNTALSPGAALIAAGGNQAVADALTGISASTLAFRGRPMVTLFSARESCQVADPAPSCARNYAVNNPVDATNTQTSKWYGDDGTNPKLNVIHGINSIGTDILYTTTTDREAFAAYTQGVWDINEAFALTLGIRYAEDELVAEENLWRYSETGGQAGGFLALYGGLAAVNRVNGGLVDDGNGNEIPTEKATNGGIPFAFSVYRPFKRKDDKVTGRINLDWNINDAAMMYFSATSSYRSGGYNLVFFSRTPTYDPEELIAYEIGYKTQFNDGTVQLNGSFYYYDYESIHTFTSEVSAVGGITTSVLAAPGAEVYGIEAELLWLLTDRVTLGGNFSYTPSEYTEDFIIADEGEISAPTSLYPENENRAQNINGNQLLQVPEAKVTGWASYKFPLSSGSTLELFGVYAWIDDVYYSPFESEGEKADDYSRVDLRVNWTSPSNKIVVSAFVNNVLDEVGILSIRHEGEEEFFTRIAGTTVPRLYGMEFTYRLGDY